MYKFDAERETNKASGEGEGLLSDARMEDAYVDGHQMERRVKRIQPQNRSCITSRVQTEIPALQEHTAGIHGRDKRNMMAV